MSRTLRMLSLLVGVLSSLAADELPSRAVARLGDYRFYHGPGIRLAVLSPDGSQIASAAAYPSWHTRVTDKERAEYARTIVLWDATTGERIHELQVPQAPQCLTFSPDSKRLAVACDLSEKKPGVILFSVKTGKVDKQLEEFHDSVRRLQFIDDGKQLLVHEAKSWVDSHSVATYEAESGKLLKRWTPLARPTDFIKEREHVIDGIPSPDGKCIAWLLSRAPDYSKLQPGDFPPPYVPCATVLLVTDTATDKVLFRKDFGSASLEAFAFSHDGRRFMTGRREFTAWDSATGKQLFTLDVQDSWRFALSPDGKRAVVGDSWSSVELWDLDGKKRLFNLYPGAVHLADTLVTPGVFSADAKSVLLATDSTLRLFDTITGMERGLADHRAPVTPRFAADGRMVITACNEAKCMWDISTEKKPKLVSREPRPSPKKAHVVGVVAQSVDERLFVADSETGYHLRETASGRVLHQLANAHEGIYVGLFSPDGSRVVLWHEPLDGKPDFLRFHDTKTGKVVGEAKTPNRVLRRWAYSPDGRFVAWVDKANDVHVLDGAAGKPIRTLTSTRPLPKAECNEASFLFSADGEYLVVSTWIDHIFSSEKKDNVILPTRLFHVASGREIRRFYYNPEKEDKANVLSHEAWSPDGRLLAVTEGESGSVRLIEVASGKVRVEFVGHRYGVHGLAFAPDGKTLASGGEDNVVYLWDVIGARTEAAVKDANEKDLAEWWNDQASKDARGADKAMGAFIRTPRSVAYFKERLHAAEAADEKRLARLLADLYADDFKTRETASRELAELDEQAEGALRKALEQRPQPEAKRRIEELLDKLESRPLPADMLRALRAVEVLEHIGTPEARKLLDALAMGAPEARLTRDAKASLKRLEK